MAVPFLRRLGDKVVVGEVVQKNAGKRQRTGAVESGNSKPPGTLCESSSESESKYSLTTSTLTWILCRIFCSSREVLALLINSRVNRLRASFSWPSPGNGFQDDNKDDATPSRCFSYSPNICWSVRIVVTVISRHIASWDSFFRNRASETSQNPRLAYAPDGGRRFCSIAVQMELWMAATNT
jgi:hypothetical protein